MQELITTKQKNFLYGQSAHYHRGVLDLPLSFIDGLTKSEAQSLIGSIMAAIEREPSLEKWSLNEAIYFKTFTS